MTNERSDDIEELGPLNRPMAQWIEGRLSVHTHRLEREFREAVQRIIVGTTDALRPLQESMVQIMSDQSKLDADVATENDALTAIEKEIADLKNQPPAAALDFSGLDAAVARMQGDAPAPTPTPTPPPAPTPSA